MDEIESQLTATDVCARCVVRNIQDGIKLITDLSVSFITSPYNNQVH